MSNETSQRFAYRYPFWHVLYVLVGAGLFLVFAAAGPLPIRILSWLLGAFALLMVGNYIIARRRRPEIVLTDTQITAPYILHFPVTIKLADIDRLVMRRGTGLGRRERSLGIQSPARSLTIEEVAMKDTKSFEHLADAVAQRVAAQGGPDLAR